MTPAIFATVALLIHQFAMMAVAAKRVSGAAARTLFSTDLDPLQLNSCALLASPYCCCSWSRCLGVYKPWGLTGYGRRKRQEPHKVQQ
jgi:hypothetical protein